MRGRSSGARRRAVTVLAALFLFALLSTAYAESGDIAEGYDENTEITVSGTIVEASRPGMMRGPVVLKLRRHHRMYYVITAPPWFLNREGIPLTEGSLLEVKGSRLYGRDGKLYLIGRQLRDPVTGRIADLRDRRCMPLWKRQR
ncbi:MAG: hypothetical protein U0411_03550 [Thermodesulfovibrionales bacterium]